MQILATTKCEKCGEQIPAKSKCDKCHSTRHDTIANRFVIINGFILLLVLAAFFMFYS